MMLTYPIQTKQIRICFIIMALILTLLSCIETHKIRLNQKNIIQDSVVYTLIRGYYPDSKLKATETLFIRGDNCNLTWNKGNAMKHTGINLWEIAILCVEGATVNVKLLIDNTTWMIGQNYQFVSKSGLTIQIYPSFKPQINKILDTGKIHSTILNNDRMLSIYFPPSYNDNNLKKYQVLLMHDGQNLFDPNKAAFRVAWLCQDTVNKMIMEGSMRQIIIVGIWNTPDRNNQYTYSYDSSYKFGGKGDKYLDFIQKQLIVQLQSKLLVGRINKENGYYIGGSSLGGLISCYAAYTRPTVFTKAICMSSSFWWNNQDFNNVVLQSQKYINNTNYYLDSGDSGPSEDGKNQTILVLNHFRKIGYGGANNNLFYYLDKGGQHNQASWGRRFNVPMSDLFK